jgi:hypothetical protein
MLNGQLLLFYIDAEEQVLGHLRYHKGDELVVLGAYRRSEISRWFKTSRPIF